MDFSIAFSEYRTILSSLDESSSSGLSWRSWCVDNVNILKGSIAFLAHCRHFSDVFLAWGALNATGQQHNLGRHIAQDQSEVAEPLAAHRVPKQTAQILSPSAVPFSTIASTSTKRSRRLEQQ